MVKYQYDYVVIGGGSAGLTSASFAADLKVSTLLIENNKIGGDCTWSGCVPSKALIHAAHEANIRGKTADYGEVHKFVKKKIEDVYALETPEVWKSRGVNILLGDAEIVDEHTLKVITKDGEQNITAKKICIASGAHPIKNDKIKGLWDDEYKEKVYTYLEFWHKESLPKTMALIGAGPIGAEIAQACSRFGCKVTIIASELLPREAESARKILTRVFKEEGIEHIPSRAASVSKDTKTNLLEVQTTDGQSVLVEEILVAVGRTPVLPKGADKFFKIGKTGGIVTNKYLKCVLKGSDKTSSSFVAAGDCIDGNLQFTHYAGKQGYYCARNSFLVGKSAGLIPLEVPRATYTAPEIASIGFTSVEEAKAAGKKNAMMLTSHGDHIDRSVTDDAQDNTLFEVILSDGGIGAKIIGANIIGPNAGEVLAPLCLAIKAKVPIKEFADVIQPYPTYSFGLMQMLGVEVTKRFKDSKTAAFAKAVNF